MFDQGHLRERRVRSNLTSHILFTICLQHLQNADRKFKVRHETHVQRCQTVRTSDCSDVLDRHRVGDMYAVGSTGHQETPKKMLGSGPIYRLCAGPGAGRCFVTLDSEYYIPIVMADN